MVNVPNWKKNLKVHKICKKIYLLVYKIYFKIAFIMWLIYGNHHVTSPRVMGRYSTLITFYYLFLFEVDSKNKFIKFLAVNLPVPVMNRNKYNISFQDLTHLYKPCGLLSCHGTSIQWIIILFIRVKNTSDLNHISS